MNEVLRFLGVLARTLCPALILRLRSSATCLGQQITSVLNENKYMASENQLYGRNPETSWIRLSDMPTNRQHGFVKRYGLVRDDRHEAPPVMVPFRRSPARPFAVLPHHRLGVLPLGSP